MEEKKVKSQIKKRSYYSFPNGVEAEDICRYLSFNLGNVVKYICQAGKKNENTKIQDLIKARDYLNNEIELCEEKSKDTVNWKWKPAVGDEYWVVTTDGVAGHLTWNNDPADIRLFNFGNCFRTSNDAKIAIEKIKHLLKEE